MNKGLLYLALSLCPFVGFSQILEINNAAEAESTMSLQELVENVLITGVCSDVSNFTQQVSGAPNESATKSYGFFKRPVNSRFPFEQGVILTTGNAFIAGNNVTGGPPGTTSATNNLPGDVDLEAALGITDTNDATFIKFDFIPKSSDFSFNFLMASEEYDMITECSFADSFAFLLREVGAPNYTNLAVLPNGTPVSVTNINNAPACAANTAFFEGYNLPHTNYGGQTVVLTASATVIPNRTYEIKLVVADQGVGDFVWDSAVFLEAGSFNIGLDLGQDLTIMNNNAPCDGNIQVLSTGFPGLVHTWYLDGVEITTDTDDMLNAVVSGTYSVEVSFGTGCDATDSIVVVFADRPILNPVTSQLVCDDDNDGFWTLDLSSFNPTVYGTQNVADYSISYHPTQNDADNNTAALASPYTNAVAYQQEEIFIRIGNNLSVTCFSVGSFIFDVFDSPSANDYIYRLCDDTADGDDTNGFIEFDLNTVNAQVLGTQNVAQFNITYHASLVDANANVGVLATPYTNSTVNAEQIFARMENIDNTNCFDIAVIDLIVDPLPVITPIVDLKQCDDDTDGITLFNLTEANILVSTNAASETFTYYLTDAEAQGGVVADQIASFTAYPNPMPLTSVVYTRIETNQGCWRTAQINLIVGATQIPAGLQLDYEVCDDVLVDGNNANGIASFDFSDATAQVIALFPVGAPITVTYYTNLADAQAETNAIVDISNHRNDTSPNLQLIYIRVDSNDVNACLGLGQHINLTVNPQPLTNPIDNYALCSDTNTASFVLTTKDNEVVGTQTQDILVSYHRNLADAQSNTAPITSPYNNVSNPEIIYVRSQFDDNGNGIGDTGECARTDMTFELQVIPNPIVFTPDLIRICSNQVGTVYNLTIRENQITGGDATINLSYFESLADLNANTPIVNPDAYTNTAFNNTIIVQATGANTCTSMVDLDLVTILYANLNLAPDIIEECEIDDDGFDIFDLRRREIQILNSLNAIDFVFRYYILEADAIAGNANNIASPEAFTSTVAVTQTIYVRIDPVADECFQIAPLPLQVNRVPEIQIEDQYVLCLDRNDNIIAPEDIALLPNPPIDTQLNNTEYTFEWYQGDAIPSNLIIGETGSAYMPTIPGEYTLIATNVATQCTIPATTTVIGSYPPESITIDVVTPAFSDNNTIEVTVEGIGDYEYNLDGGPWQDSPIFENVLGGEHTVFVRDTLNCGQVFTMATVIDYPKFFTPNGDTYNDTWNIKDIKDQPSAKIYIFDRYGKFIKQLSSLTDGWDGTFNGRKMPSNDYWFTVEYIDPIDNAMKIFKAHFTLKR